MTVKCNQSDICGCRRTVINTTNLLGQTGTNDWTAFGPNAMIGQGACLSVNLPPGSSQAACSCVLEEWLLREGVRYFGLNLFKRAKMFRFAKLYYPAFNVWLVVFGRL